MEEIETAEQYFKKELIAWVSYPFDRSYCFVYPRFLSDSGKWREIEPAAFPNTGSLYCAIAGGADSNEIQNKYGSIVVATINTDQLPENWGHDPNSEKSTLYRLKFNPSFPKGASDLDLTSFSSHPLSTELIQIVDVKSSVSFLKPFSEPITIDETIDDLVCAAILVRNSNGTYFGPFHHSEVGERAITLNAPKNYDYRIARLKSLPANSILAICDEDGAKRCELIDKQLVDEMFAKAKSEGETIDWMPQSELAEIVVRVINASDEFKKLGKNGLRSIKTAIRELDETTAQVTLDDERIVRVTDWLSQLESIAELPSQLADGIVATIDDEKILGLIQNDLYFPSIKETILESERIQDCISEERKALEATLSEVRNRCDLAEKEQLEAEQEAQNAKIEAAKAHEELELIREEALAQKREELNNLDEEIAKRKDELDRVEREYEQAIVNKNKIANDVDEIIGGINDEVATSTKILESEILRKVVAAVSGVDLREKDQELPVGYSLRTNEDEMADSEVVDLIYGAITQRAGRQISKNDAINIMTCVMQGYITTFAGLPGTGKTSLCNILGATLGLLNKDAGGRFTEINVENGWTSYKDYVGYYNPLAKTYEKANASVYDAMHMLSNETVDPSSVPPYFFLLDEANLSPIEHYWAPFLRACDTFLENGATFSLGGTREWSLPSHVRFLATVNFDHTTEALSNRFLDRSWVITLDPEFIDPESEQINIAAEFAHEKAFSIGRLFQAFGYKQGDTLGDNANNELLEELIRVCRSHSFAISPRSQLMMKRYISTASRLMSLQSKDSQYAPLDYAFSQKVLPQISGPMETTAELIDDLADRCSQLKTTKRQLDRMKEFGKDSGFYQYFI